MTSRPPLRAAAAVFLKLGLIGFGGPAAHVALMRKELVERRRWLPEQEFLRTFAACNLIPGPSSTELAIYVGYRLCGWPGLLAAGVLFILPAAVAMTAIGAAYTRFGANPAAVAILLGVRPVVVGIVLWAAVDLGRRIVTGLVPGAIVAAAAALMVAGIHPIAVLLAGGLAGLAAGRRRSGAVPMLAAALTGLGAGKLLALFLTFLKIGALSFGSGYTLLAFLRSDVVGGLHIVSERQLVDAVAIGQATPGPLFTSATFIGFLAAGLPGAVVATVGIFTPGFLFVPFLDRLMRWVELHASASEFIAGANAAALGLIVAVTLELARAAITGPADVLLALAALAVSLRRPLAAPLVVLGGAAAGLLLHRP